MLLEQVSLQPVADGQTPWWVTIVGWIVTIIAAILPSFINFVSNRKLRKDVNNLQDARKKAIDKVKFGEQRGEIIQNLKKYIRAIERNVNGKSTIAGLNRTLATVQSYAERLGFSAEDKKTISHLLNLTRELQIKEETLCNNITSDMVQAVIEILSKGEYLI